jgi:DNA-binding transcriptional LysR family regulator
MISSGEVDFGLNAHLKYEIDFEKTLLFQEPLLLICQTTHPLARKKSVKLQELEQQPFIYTSKVGSVRKQVDNLLKDLKIIDSGFEGAQLITIIGLVAYGFGISILPKSTLNLITQPDIVSIPIESPNCLRPIYLVKKRNRSLSFASQALWDQLLSNAKQNFEY